MTIYNSDRRFFTRAISLAKNGEHRVRVGALGVVQGKPLAGAWNIIRNVSPVNFSDISVHAEVSCAHMITPRLLDRTVIYVARLNKNDEPMPSEPCSKCMKYLSLLGLKGFVYLNKDLQLVKYEP